MSMTDLAARLAGPEFEQAAKEVETSTVVSGAVRLGPYVEASVVIDFLDAIRALHAEIAALKAERDVAIRADICDVCAGTGKPAGNDCMCSGTGRMSDAAAYLRMALFTAEAARDAALADVERLRWRNALKEPRGKR